MSSTLGGSRFLGLDLLRFLAALVVFLGHLIFNAKTGESTSSALEFFLGPLHMGKYAVLFFFALSGFVLTKQNFTEIDLRIWIISRWVRLMPVFYITYIIGLILLVVGKSYKPNTKNTLIEITGLGSLTSIGVPAPNPPLWSLSVELLLSFLLPLLVRVKRASILVLILVLGIAAQQTVIGSFSIVPAFPYFLAGVISSKLLKDKLKDRGVYNYLILCILVAISFFSTSLVTGPTTLVENIVAIFAICFLIVCGSQAMIQDELAPICRRVSMRSYSLYAIHWPIIKSVQELTNPSNGLTWSIYLIASIIFVMIGTEILYRFVEVPAISASKRLRIQN
jgi:peptidoglycan/LPS O-acetylase OafA/YrhL